MAASEKRPEIIELARGLARVPLCEDYECMISGMMCVSFKSLHFDGTDC